MWMRLVCCEELNGEGDLSPAAPPVPESQGACALETRYGALPPLEFPRAPRNASLRGRQRGWEAGGICRECAFRCKFIQRLRWGEEGKVGQRRDAPNSRGNLKASDECRWTPQYCGAGADEGREGEWREHQTSKWRRGEEGGTSTYVSEVAHRERMGEYEGKQGRGERRRKSREGRSPFLFSIDGVY